MLQETQLFPERCVLFEKNSRSCQQRQYKSDCTRGFPFLITEKLLPFTGKRSLESDGLQFCEEFLCCSVTLITRFNEGSDDDLLQFIRDIFSEKSVESGFFINDRIKNGRLIFTLKGRLACDHLINDHTQRPDIGSRVDLFAVRLFG